MPLSHDNVEKRKSRENRIDVKPIRTINLHRIRVLIHRKSHTNKIMDYTYLNDLYFIDNK